MEKYSDPKSKTSQKEFNRQSSKLGYGPSSKYDTSDSPIPEFFSINKEEMRDIYKKRRSDSDPLPDELDRMLEKRDPKALKTLKRVTSTKPKASKSDTKKKVGGSVKMAKGGYVRKADGCAQRGKTKGRMV